MKRIFIKPKPLLIKNFLFLIIRSLCNGLQWVGWSLAVLISQQVVQNILGWTELRNIIVSIAIAINEIVCSQCFGRLLIWLDSKLNSIFNISDDDEEHRHRNNNNQNTNINLNDVNSTSTTNTITNNNNNNNNNININNNTNNHQNRNENSEMITNSSKPSTSIHKNMLGCVASGIVFDFVDRAIGNIFSESKMYEITLLMRCLCVFVADRLVFHVLVEILDRIEEQSWTLSNTISNIEGASCAGISAIAYNLATELGVYICREHIKTDNDWLIGLFCIPLITIATGIGFVLGVLEAKLWQLLDNARLYSKLQKAVTKKQTQLYHN